MSTGVLIRALVILAIAALALAFVVAFVALMTLLSGALLILAGAIFLAYAITPVVGLLRRRLPVVAAVGITYLVLLSIVVLVFLISLPPLTSEAQQLFTSIPSIADSARRSIVESGVLARLPRATPG